MNRTALKKSLLILLGLSLCSLSISTYLLFLENKKLRDFYQTTDPQYEELQKLKALRNFIDLQYNYNAENFKKNQNLAKNYVEIKLIASLYRELDSVYTNILKDQVQQSAELLSIHPHQKSIKTYELIMKITNKSKMDQLTIYNKVTIKIEKTYRSFENPEGYWITQLEQSILTQAPASELSMFIEPNRLSILSVPCSVNQIENPNPQFEIKLTKGNQSEIQIRGLDQDLAQTTLDIFCDRTQFKIEVSNITKKNSAANEIDEKDKSETKHELNQDHIGLPERKADYFKSIFMSQGTQTHRLKKQNPVANELKNDLGIIIESAD